MGQVGALATCHMPSCMLSHETLKAQGKGTLADLSVREAHSAAAEASAGNWEGGKPSSSCMEKACQRQPSTPSHTNPQGAAGSISEA